MQKPRPVSVLTALVLGAGFLLLAGGPASAQSSESERFAGFLDRVYTDSVQASPLLATQYGERVGADRWDDLSAAAQAADAAQVRRWRDKAVSEFDFAKLDPPTRLQQRVFVNEQQLLLDRYRWRDHFYPLNQIVGLHVLVPDILANQQPLESVADARAYIKRIGAVRPLFGQLSTNMRAQARKGIYMPKSVYPILIKGSRSVISGAPFDNGPDNMVFGDFKRRVELLSLSRSEKDALIAQCRTALLKQFKPAYEQLIVLLELQAAKTPIDGGVWQLPHGDEFYEFLVRQFTTTKMSPAEIHELGLREVARVHAEMESIMRAVGFQGTVREFMAKTKADPRFYYENNDSGRAAYLARARQIVGGMQARLPEAFPAGAPLPLEIRRTELYKEPFSPVGFYEPGSVDGRRPGTVYLNLSDMTQRPIYDLEDLLYHEGVPGHHMQISTIMTQGGVPKLRKFNQWWQDTAFVEGWGLYAERLAKDMGGFFQDPYSEFGQLSGELWRACRLVVDSGLHYKHWTREEAIRYLRENTPTSDETIVREVDRYLVVPGQATAFTVGMLEFVAQRERARQALGPAFDLREYHRVALQNGFLPLWALDEAVTQWIASKSAAR